MNESKPGVKTTEFWVTLAPILITWVEGKHFDGEQSKYMILAGSVLASLYIISRTVVKFKEKE